MVDISRMSLLGKRLLGPSVNCILTIAALAGGSGVLCVTRAETGLPIVTLTRVTSLATLLVLAVQDDLIASIGSSLISTLVSETTLLCVTGWLVTIIGVARIRVSIAFNLNSMVKLV